MSEFLYLFRGGDSRHDKQTPEEFETHMERWKSWMGELATNGKLKGGQPLALEGSVVGAGSVTDGPFAEGKEIVGGYLMVNAESREEAVELSKGCPILEFDDGTVEVREIRQMDM